MSKEAIQKKLEEHEEIVKYVQQLEKETRHYYSGSVLKQLKSYVEHFKKNSTDAENVLGAFIENQVTFYRALQLMVRNYENGGTHRIKKYRAKALEEMLEEAITTLIEDKNNHHIYHLSYFDTWNRSWDFRRIAGENWRLKKQVEELQAKVSDEDNTVEQSEQMR